MLKILLQAGQRFIVGVPKKNGYIVDLERNVTSPSKSLMTLLAHTFDDWKLFDGNEEVAKKVMALLPKEKSSEGPKNSLPKRASEATIDAK